jgi:hypothetical protein
MSFAKKWGYCFQVSSVLPGGFEKALSYVKDLRYDECKSYGYRNLMQKQGAIT